MSSNPIDPVSDRSAEWNEAWKSVRRLADARRTVAESAGAHNASVAGLNGATRASSLAIDPRADDISSISMQAQLDFAEIISASTALRTAQPDLEAWTNAKSDLVQTHKPRSVWLVIGAVWISTVLLLAMATFAIASLLS
jgi:hypothetical protein